FPDNARVSTGFDDDEIIRTDAAQRDRIRRVRVIGPVPLSPGLMNKAAVAQKLENFCHIVTAEPFPRAKRKLEHGTLQMTDQNMDVVRIDQAHLRRLA